MMVFLMAVLYLTSVRERFCLCIEYLAACYFLCHLQCHYITRTKLKIRIGCTYKYFRCILSFSSDGQRPALSYLLAVVILLDDVTEILNWNLKDIDGDLLIKLRRILYICVYTCIYISSRSHGNFILIVD
jgi:hypothetical protein